MSYPREKIHELMACPTEDDHHHLASLLDQVAEDRAHQCAEYLRAEARRIEDEYRDRHGEVYAMYLHGAKRLRHAANTIDPYDIVAGTKVLVRKSDGREVIRGKVQ